MDQTEANIIINMAGKGPAPRKVNLEEYGKNYDSIFRKNDKSESDKKMDLYKELAKDIIKLNTRDGN